MRQTLAAVALLLLSLDLSAAVTSTGPTTTNNDDSCDVALLPAATLLLPYFEVETGAAALTTLVTVTNTSAVPQIAHMTIWTDWGFPVLGFNLFLTGYDVQALNLSDVLLQGRIAPPSGTSNRTNKGPRSLDNDANPNFLASAGSTCSTIPSTISGSILSDLQDVLRTGRIDNCGSARVGGNHNVLAGYITIDVVATCTQSGPAAASYYRDEILFDNVLVGDYQMLDPDATTGNYAGGNPLVHIRAIPEGGRAGAVSNSSLPYTFYDRYTAASGVPRNQDRRQPLPSTFAARFIQGGTGSFNSDFKIWREGVAPNTNNCTAYAANGTMRTIDAVRFDEHENATALAGNPGTQFPAPQLPVSSRTATASSVFPPMSNVAGDVGGWMYLNLNNGGSTAYSVTLNGVSDTTAPTLRDFVTGSSTVTGVRQSQNWVTVWMTAEGRFGTEFDAPALANGCTISPPATNATNRLIGPGGNTTP